jgi:hypothetical protein
VAGLRSPNDLLAHRVVANCSNRKTSFISSSENYVSVLLFRETRALVFLSFLSRTETYQRDLRRSKHEAERNADMRTFLEAASLLRTSQKFEKPLFAVHGTNDPQLSFLKRSESRNERAARMRLFGPTPTTNIMALPPARPWITCFMRKHPLFKDASGRRAKRGFADDCKTLHFQQF